MSLMKMADIKSKSPEDLLKSLEETKAELSSLRVAQVTQSAHSKVAKIKSVRKQIARILTVINTNNKKAALEQSAGSKRKNLDLRSKKTRALRRALTKDQLYVRASSQPLTEKSGKAARKYVRRVTKREATRKANFPARMYAVKAL
ncbi:60S ribosomal protein L35 [Hondaea fermentalgiana]|uniref:60S ribosomal protein L35 n=1 Tax=Hondaea fermentalgiana TaxID=2315210 RepID=A0A2R5GUG0_9STRA|nr:60S ribosomal protein L35 [Hondaea fermentalgiana]|eukprot:GBG33398.1 60S ribosomal protein L35 [Hondaea fermentalgiana]